MSAKVTLKITKGHLSGKIFPFDQKESLILGRQDDCNIVLSESTISRYHCLLDVIPPSVMVRDFGSLNGTYLNGEKIGQRGAGMSIEEARKQRYNEFPMKAGDRLGLGKDCEITLDIVIPQYCAGCFCEIEQPEHVDKDNMPVCADCHEKARQQKIKEEKEERAARKMEQERLEAEKRAKELAEKERAAADALDRERVSKERKEAEQRAAALAEKERQEAERRAKEEEARKAIEMAKRKPRRCEVCGDALTGDADEPNVCPACRKNPLRILECMLKGEMKGNEDVQEIAGYRNIRSLGRGGMGAVWLVEEEKTGKQLALKLMLPEVASNERSRQTFLREAYIAGQLDHKNVVRQFKCGQSGDTYFILMELCQGGSVDNLIKRNGGKLGLDLATHITLQVLDGLHYAHHAPVVVTLKDGKTLTANGIVHRDFKPGNIFLSDNTSRSVAKVADFGLAKAFETAGLSGHTRTGDVAGTVVFMPRQQIINYRYAKPDVDVWAAAASYYYMLTGTFPKEFSGQDAIRAALANPAVPISKRNAGIPKRLADVIDTALTDKPEIGIRSALELKTAIERAL